jgi:peroxiredoxin
VAIDPACWTLDGLHMKVGTDVCDRRVSRSIGYWTGAGLSEQPLPTDKPPQDSSNRAQNLALLASEPRTPEALDAAEWILLNSPDGAEVQTAAEVILQEHIENPDLAGLAQGLERMRHNCSSNLLQAMLDKNPNPAVRGNACLALATLRKEAADFGKNKRATAESEKLYQRVISEFGQVKQRGYPLSALARPELSDLRQLSLGKVAPEIEGYDLYDRPLRLSDYRGKVVVLLFWSAFSPGESEACEYGRLAEQMSGKPFALLGVPSADEIEQAKTVAEKYAMTWPSFQEDRQGPITTTYNVKSWPTVFVLDRNGVIRHRGLRFRSEIAAAVEKLLKE